MTVGPLERKRGGNEGKRTIGAVEGMHSRAKNGMNETLQGRIEPNRKERNRIEKVRLYEPP